MFLVADTIAETAIPSGDQGTQTMDEREPTDALAVLADETRIAILRALADADGVLAFTELRRRAGVDDAGRFNYHLTKLCEHFVREVDGGYALGHAGTRVVAAASRPGSSTASLEAEESRREDGESTECPVCGEDDCGRLFHVHLSVPWR